MKIELEIQAMRDREELVKALANSGYKVTVEHRKDLCNDDYYIIVEDAVNKIKEIDNEPFSQVEKKI